MNRIVVGVVAAAALLLGACGHPWGPGPGAGGPGPWAMGPGGPGPGAGWGPMGPGMMGGGPGGWGMGPGMMGNGPGGWGMGPGMMGGGPGGWGMGPGMMGGGWGGGGPGWGLAGLDLSADQRARIGEIQAEVARRQWELMSAMHAQGGPMWGGPGQALDESAARQAYEAMSAAHKQMFELQLESRRRVLEVLTPAQREQLGRAGPGR